MSEVQNKSGRNELLFYTPSVRRVCRKYGVNGTTVRVKAQDFAALRLPLHAAPCDHDAKKRLRKEAAASRSRPPCAAVRALTAVVITCYAGTISLRHSPQTPVRVCPANRDGCPEGRQRVSRSCPTPQAFLPPDMQLRPKSRPRGLRRAP